MPPPPPPPKVKLNSRTVLASPNKRTKSAFRCHFVLAFGEIGVTFGLPWKSSKLARPARRPSGLVYLLLSAPEGRTPAGVPARGAPAPPAAAPRPVSFRRPRGAGPGSSPGGPRSSQTRLEAGARGVAPQLAQCSHSGGAGARRGAGSGGGASRRRVPPAPPTPAPARRAPRARPRRRLRAPRPGLSVPGRDLPARPTRRRAPGPGPQGVVPGVWGGREGPGGRSPSSSSRSRWLKIPQKLGRLLMSFLSFISCIR